MLKVPYGYSSQKPFKSIVFTKAKIFEFRLISILSHPIEVVVVVVIVHVLVFWLFWLLKLLLLFGCGN